MKGFQHLGSVIRQEVQNGIKSPLVLDFGVIQEDYSLLTNTYPIPIPIEDYSICRSVSWNPAKPMTMTWWQGEDPVVEGWEEEDWSEKGWQGGEIYLHKPPDTFPDHEHNAKGKHNHSVCSTGIHYHDVYLPDKMRWIKPGDRVLVAWVGVDAIVIDLILNAKVVLESG